MQPDKADIRDKLVQGGRELARRKSEGKDQEWLALRTGVVSLQVLMFRHSTNKKATRKRVKGLLRGRPRRGGMEEGAVVTMMMKECVLVDDDMDLWGPVSRLGRQQKKAITSGHVNNI